MGDIDRKSLRELGTRMRSTATQQRTRNRKDPSVPTSTTSAPNPPTSIIQVASPREVNRWLKEGSAILIDVREADEHSRERISGASPRPLSTLDAAKSASLGSQDVALVFHCKSGRRSAEACRLVAPFVRPGTPVLSMGGGIEAWRAEGLPTITANAGCALSVMRQTQLIIGLGVLLSVALGWLLHPAFLALAAFFGAGLTFAGSTGTCGLALLLSKMPWNRLDTPPSSTPPSTTAASTACGGNHCACVRR